MDDQAETYLLGSLRGRAVGMPVSGTVIRPFLSVRRADTVAACAELGLEVWHDPMNADPRFRRVRVRTEGCSAALEAAVLMRSYWARPARVPSTYPAPSPRMKGILPAISSPELEGSTAGCAITIPAGGRGD